MNRSSSKPTERTRTTPDRRDTRLGATGLHFAAIVCVSLATTVACEDNFGGNAPPGSGGTGGSEQGGSSAAKGGSTAKGGTTSKPSSGGSNTAGNASGGDSGNAGAVGNGGTTATGGTSNDASGGTSSVTTGGTTATGGTSSVATGGSSSLTAGGTTATGGTSNDASGGTSSVTTGGTTATGGTSSVATGGTSSVTTGGTTATGGTSSVAAGGTSSVATGGTSSVATGGTSSVATGGSSAAGGTTSTTPGPAVAILQYDFDTIADTVAKDSTSNANDGLLTSVSLAATGRNGGDSSFAAANSGIAMPTGLLPNVSELSVSAWVKLTANAAENRLFTFGSGSNAYVYLTLNNSDTTTPGISLRFLLPGGTEQALTTPTQIPLNVWKHVTVTLSTAGSAIYVDGKVVAESATLGMAPSAIGTETGNFVGNAEGGANAFQGQIDEFHVYSGLLTQSEIYALAAPKTDYTMYHFDEGSGSAVADASERAKNGNLVGGATWVTGVFGGAVRLSNGATGPGTQYVRLATGVLEGCTTNLTVAGWVNLATNRATADFFTAAPDNTWNYRVTSAYNSSGDMGFQLQYVSTSGTTTNNVTRVVRSPRTWTLSEWYHVAAVRRPNNTGTAGQGLDFYVNGQLLTNYTKDGSTYTTSMESFGTGASIAAWAATATMNYLGKSRDDLSNPGLDGSIDEVLIACRNYTAGEIKQLAYKP